MKDDRTWLSPHPSSFIVHPSPHGLLNSTSSAFVSIVAAPVVFDSIRTSCPGTSSHTHIFASVFVPPSSPRYLYHFVFNSVPATLIVSVPSSYVPGGVVAVRSGFGEPFGKVSFFGTSRFSAGALTSPPFAFDTTAYSTTTLSAPTSTSVVVMIASDVMPLNVEVVLRVIDAPFLYLLQAVNSRLSMVSWAAAGPAARASTAADRTLAKRITNLPNLRTCMGARELGPWATSGPRRGYPQMCPGADKQSRTRTVSLENLGGATGARDVEGPVFCASCSRVAGSVDPGELRPPSEGALAALAGGLSFWMRCND